VFSYLFSISGPGEKKGKAQKKEEKEKTQKKNEKRNTKKGRVVG